MALISIIEDFHPLNNAKLLDRAAELAPSLHHEVAEPVGGFQLKERYSPEKEEIVLHEVPHLAMGRGQNLCLDFGTHIVGYLTLELSYTGSHPDAPAFLKLKFAENIRELSENTDDYSGWISRSWIQEEYVHIDVLPAKLTLPRRYAFRYLKITMMDTSPKYRLIVKHAECLTETSANWRRLPEYQPRGERMDRIREVSLRTLANCMQDVFEDGPKRDQRLWMGDLRLQALTNYVSFRKMDLVKRCLYLFAGSRFPDGRVAACLFTKPAVQADDTYLFDYSLFFTIAVEEYLQETNDEEALTDLYDIAMQQIETALRGCERTADGRGLLLSEKCAGDAFLDWTEGLDHRAGAQAVLIFAIRYARRLARRRNDWSQSNWLGEQEALLKNGAMSEFWDRETECFVSGGQISAASQMWMVLADVLDPEAAEKLMRRVQAAVAAAGEMEAECADRDEHFAAEMAKYPMVTPDMHHYYLMALIRAGLKAEAEQHILLYWGSMIDAGADTFFESWDPADPGASPYGGAAVNSFCHAWSCTPAYIMERYL